MNNNGGEKIDIRDDSFFACLRYVKNSYSTRGKNTRKKKINNKIQSIFIYYTYRISQVYDTR